jgi:hypothetical protein
MAKGPKKPGKRLTLKKKALGDLPLKKNSKGPKGGGSSLLLGGTGTIAFSPPYVPVGPVGDMLKPIILKPPL